MLPLECTAQAARAVPPQVTQYGGYAAEHGHNCAKNKSRAIRHSVVVECADAAKCVKWDTKHGWACYYYDTVAKSQPRDFRKAICVYTDFWARRRQTSGGGTRGLSLLNVAVDAPWVWKAKTENEQAGRHGKG